MYTLFFVCEVCQENVSDTWCTQSYMYVWDGTLRYKLGKLVSFGCIFSRGCFWDKVPALICFSLKLEDLLIQSLVLRVITVTVAIGLRGSTLFRWAGASRRGAVSFRKVVPCTCHARIDPTPVLGFMSVTAEQLGIRDWTKQTSVRLLQRDTSHLTLDISGSCLHLQHPAWMNFMISGKKLQFSESDLSKVFETHTSGWK